MKKWLLLIVIGTVILSKCSINELPGFKGTPKASFSLIPNKTEFTIEEEIGFENTSTGGNFEWNFGSQALPSSTSTLKYPGKISYSTTGEKEIKLKVYFGSQTVSDAISISIKIVERSISPPKPDFSFSPDSCIAPCTIQFTNKSINADEFQWDFGDGNTSMVLTPPPKLYNNAGNYIVRLTARNAGSVKDTSKIVKILPAKPKAIFEVINDSCIVSCEVQFKNNSTASTSFIWDFGDGKGPELVLDKSTKTIRYESKGTKKVKLVAINSIGEKDSLTVNVTALPNYFKKTFDLSTVPIYDPIASERNDKLIHLFYREGTAYRSVLIDRNRGPKSTMDLGISSILSINQVMPRINGEILILAENNDTKFANFIRISGSQSIIYNQAFKFNNDSKRSIPNAFIINTAEHVCITGNREHDKGYSIGFTRLLLSTGIIQKNTFFYMDDDDISKNWGYGDAIVQNPDGSYLIKVGIFAILAFNSQLFNLTAFENQGTRPKFNPSISGGVLGSNMVLTNNRYFISNGSRLYQIKTDGTIVNQNLNVGFNISDMIINNSNNIILLGTNGSDVYWAEISKSGSISNVQNKRINLGIGTPTIKSVMQTIDDGYLLSGTYLLGGHTDIFLVKLNAKGDID